MTPGLFAPRARRELLEAVAYIAEDNPAAAENLRVLLSEREAAYWDFLKRQVTQELRLQRHRASSDAKILQRTLMRLREPLPSRF